ncbi:hypothetical protein HQ496_13260 [bacterium]|nr:hypothetical protein [bacterium]
MEKQQVVWFGMKVTPEQKQKIKLLAKKQGVSAKEAVMRLVEDALLEDKIVVPKGSFLSGIEELIGSVNGPSDLSTNRTHLKGFGR